MSVKLCQSNCKTKVASKLTKTCLLVCLGCFIFFLIGIGSGLYSATVLNKPTPTPIAVERFHHLYKVEGKLEDEIREKVVPKVKDIADDTVQIVNEMVHRLVRSERSINSSPPKNKKYWKKTLKKLARPKRELSSHFTPENLDPIQHTEKEAPIVVEDKLVREKRRALEDLRQEFFRCKQFTGNDCGEIYREMSKLSQEIDERFARMRSIVRELNPDEGKVPENPKPLYSKMDYDKMKEEKRRMKQLQGHESIDCSSEEINGKGCARKTFNIYENDTNIVHVKTKTYTKPSTIGISSTTQAILSSRTSTEQSSTVTTSKVESTSINVTPAFPEDPKENEFRARSVFKAPPRPMYRDHYGNQMGYAPPPNENLDHHLSHELMYKQKPYGLQQETRFHHRFMNNKRLEDFVENPAIVQVDPISVTTKRPEMKRTTKTTTTTTTEDPVQSKIMGAHGTLLSVCEQFARDNAKNVKTDANGNILSANGNFQARPVSSVGQQLPQTGQSSKASAQVFVNPGFNQMGVPLCFMSQFNPTPLNQWYANYYGQSGPQAMSRGFPQNQFIQPTPFPFPGNYPNNNYGRNLVMAPSAPSQGNYYCAFMPQANQQIPGGFGTFRTSENMGLDGNQQIPTVTEHTNVPSETDIIYASFTNKPVKNVTEIVARASVSCPPGTMACAGSGECIEISKWCDSRINCMDASDEVACSCKARLPAIRICDGVIDCPLGDDELGCNGCDKFSFTCYNSQDEFRAAHGSTTSMCYTVNDRCDGIRNCMNGKDEKDCNIIVKNIGGYLSHEVSYTDGFLYRNFKGKWYPVCKNPENWAKMACDAEVGHSSENPRIVNQPNPNVLGHFVSNKGGSLQDPDVHEHCDAPTYVSCPQIKCGRVKNPHEPSKKKRQTPSPLKFDNETVSIVGGTDCHPHEWPFVVSIFKNGRHHCGGAIKSQQWIITAAHCFHSYHKHYYEVKAGALRHRSYNPEVQFSPIIKVFVYPEYNQKAMIEDLALVKIATPLNYNRYVRPICMPAPGRSGHESDWKMGPPAHQICSVIGWGTIAENGPHPDGLKQVKFPILPTCKNNNNGKAICAGELAGGRDACQGDSGGPLLCNSLSDSSEWYLAGVVSHGEGCAREGRAGIYTRISLYLDWLDQTEAHDGDPGTYPITACNGFKCIWGGGKCLPRKSRCNGIVECLGGEDEVDCQFSAHQLRTIENNRFRADDDEATTTTQAARTTIIDSTSKASTEIPLSTEPETTIIVSSSTTTETSSTSESTTTESTTEMKTEPETTIKTMEETTTTTPEPSTSPSTTESTTISSTTTTEPTPTSQSTVTTRTTSRDGRQISFESTLSPISTNSPVMESPQNATIDTGRFLFPLRSTTTLAPETTTTLTTVPSTSGFVPIPIESSTMKPLINSLTADPVKNDKFLCKNIPQKINPIHRCDRQTDCEDGTDEFNCTCKEFLVHQEPQKICDGFVDCVDLTDEEGCCKI
uniref:CSON014457 protein n=1 Tax=Culicoides sonorensis TaxID=179676 RepID=A0A336MDC0_CULSO